jgi:predicted HNH restriction endonuclease
MSQSQTKKLEKSSSKSDNDVNAGSLTSNNNNQILKMLGESDQQNSSRNIDTSGKWRSNPA